MSSLHTLACSFAFFCFFLFLTSQLQRLVNQSVKEQRYTHHTDNNKNAEALLAAGMTGCRRHCGKQGAVAASLLSTGQTEMGQCCSRSNAGMRALGEPWQCQRVIVQSSEEGRERDPKHQYSQILTFSFEAKVLKTHKLNKTFQRKKQKGRKKERNK